VNTEFDVAIIGGGPIGAALALALQNSTLSCCVLEARPANTGSRDARALALSYGSRLLLSRLNVWDALNDVSEIRTIHISQQKSFGRTLLHAEELNVPDLGYVLPYPALQDTMAGTLQQSSITSIYGASVSALQTDTDGTHITFQHDEKEHTLNARLAVVADGGKLLEATHPPEVHDYGQSALITHITCASPKTKTAFERFTPQGPVALLPFKEGYELVWTAPHQLAQEMLDWDDAKFLQALQQHFGDRVGEFLTVGKRTYFPLGLRRAPNQMPIPHTILLGNAAQTMHPVAGQGFNMGLRDAWELAQEILDVTPETLGTETMLKNYCGRRQTDRNGGIRFTDGLVKLFSNDLPGLSSGRAATLTALDCLPFAKKFVAKRMMFGTNG
jgi:2-octaprenyl-6-methoxyphenol hydroxylase